METISIKVTHYYNHVILYPFMPQGLFDTLEQAFLHDQEKATVQRWEYDMMIREFLNLLRN